LKEVPNKTGEGGGYHAHPRLFWGITVLLVQQVLQAVRKPALCCSPLCSGDLRLPEYEDLIHTDFEKLHQRVDYAPRCMEGERVIAFTEARRVSQNMNFVPGKWLE
jgi:hypothetical protein